MQSSVIVWPGGEHAFRLALAQCEGLQQATDCGPDFLLAKFESRLWSPKEAFEVLRWGLIGGGMEAVEAKRVVTGAFDRADGYAEFKTVALRVLLTALYGPPDDPAGEDSPAGDPTQSQPATDAGSSAPSTL